MSGSSCVCLPRFCAAHIFSGRLQPPSLHTGTQNTLAACLQMVHLSIIDYETKLDWAADHLGLSIRDVEGEGPLPQWCTTLQSLVRSVVKRPLASFSAGQVFASRLPLRPWGAHPLALVPQSCRPSCTAASPTPRGPVLPLPSARASW